jgi:hypothetical protein
MGGGGATGLGRELRNLHVVGRVGGHRPDTGAYTDDLLAERRAARTELTY